MKKLISALLLFVFFLSNCSQSIKISREGFSEIVPLAGNIDFTFNQDMVPVEKINVWDTTQYVLFDPPLHGKFKWKSKRELVFSPYHYLRPSTQYKAHFNENAQGLIVDDNKTIEFHTPFFQIENFEAYFAKETLKSNQTVIRYDFEFNYRIKPADLKEKLLIDLNGKQVAYELLSHEISDKVSVIVEDFDLEMQEAITKIKISKGLKILNLSRSRGDIVEKTEIIDPDDFQIKEIKANHDGFTGTVTITANQDVVEANVKSYIEVVPAVSFTASVEGRKIYVKSDKFDVTKKYTINIKEGLTGTLGGKLKYEYTEEISFGKLRPEIKILNRKAEYLSGKGLKNIEIRVVSVPDVKVTIHKVYKNNLLSYLTSRSYYSGDYYYDDYYYYGGPRSVGNLGDKIYEKEIPTTSLPTSNGGRLLNLNFEDKVGKHEGLYVLEIRSKDDYWLNARKIISISDIGLIAKKGEDKLFIFANSIKSAKPLSNVKVEVTGKNNQSLGTVETNKEGLAIFDIKKMPADNFVPALLTAKLGNDYNFLPFNRTKIQTSRFEISGKTENLAGYDAFIYGDRDIYRPGETMHVSVILRDEDWKVPGQIPVKLRIIAPNGKRFKTVKKTLNQFGSCETDVVIPASAPTGSYSVEVYTSTDVYLSSKSLKVEEFVPDRIKVDVKADKNEMFLGESLNVKIQANNLFGPPATNRNYEVQENLRRAYFYAKKYRSYYFALTGGKTYFKSNVRSGKTNEQGQASENYKYPSSYTNMGVLRADYYITVFDETGRPVNRRTSAKIYTQNEFYGINLPDYYNKTNKMMRIPLIAVDKDGSALNGVKASVKVIKHEYRTVLAKSGSRFRYKSEHEEVVKYNQTITLSGEKTTLSFTPKSSGRYDIRVSKPGSKTYVQQSFYSYGWGSTTNSSFQVNNEGNIDIELDKDKYKVGEKAKVILNTPFSGKVLVTVERKNITDHFYLKTDKRAVSFDLDIKDDFVPNIYISATLIKPHGKSDIPLTVAHGYQPVLVENPSNRIPVTISAVEKSHSKTKQKIKIKSKPNTAMTIAVVDEGILQVTGYQTPDPYTFFYRKRALGVNSYNIYPYLFPEIEIKTGREGGGAGGLEKRINPMTNKRFKLVAFWSGIKTTDKNGNLEYEIDIPQFSGDLRIMAVAYKDKAFGAGSANMKVADPVVISTALPRFLSPNDQVEMSVNLSNTTANLMDADLSIDVEGPIKMLGKTSDKVNISANSEKQLYYQFNVAPELGEAKVKVTVSANGKKYTNETDISVRPASPLQKISGSGVVHGGANQQINMEMARFMPQSIDNKLLVSNSPLVQFSDDLGYLVRYPYGCVEQTISAAFPQLYYADLAKQLSGSDDFDVDYNIKAAIRKLQLMQLYNGALAYWPGQGTESWWGSVYGAHFLIEAKKAGYEVDQSMIDKLLEYLKNKLKRKRTISYWFNGNNNKKIAPKEVAYSLYVMALAGKAKMSYMNYYKSRRDELSLDAKYLLAASYAITGDKKKYQQIVPKEFSGEESRPVFGGSFHSPIRDEAISLNAVLEVDPESPQVGVMAKHLSEKMKARRYLNTQERVFAFLALGKIAKQAAKSNVSGEILSSNKKIADYNNKTLSLLTKQLKGGNISIKTKGKGRLYYFWEAEGISKDGSYLEEDKYLKVRKTFYDRFGREITDNQFKQNDLVVVKLSVQGSNNTSIENVVVSDILPAGFEIENPRISSVPGMSWTKNKGYPQYTDIRDDRINYFVTVTSKIKNYYYVVRAVTPGVFQMGPVGADAMYNGEYHSYNGGGVVTIVRK